MEEMVPCDECGQPKSDRHKFCPHCGARDRDSEVFPVMVNSDRKPSMPTSRRDMGATRLLPSSCVSWLRKTFQLADPVPFTSGKETPHFDNTGGLARGKREFYEGVHGIPWEIDEPDAIDRFRAQFRCELESISDTPREKTAPEIDLRSVTMSGGAIYGIQMEVWYLMFGRKRDREPYRLYWVWAKGFEDVHRSLALAKQQMTRKYGRHDKEGEGCFSWYYREMQRPLALHTCALNMNSHLTINVSFIQLERWTEFGHVGDVE